jgi:hypothetical protein
MSALPHGGQIRLDGLIATNLDHRMTGKERREVLRHTDGAHAGAATAVRDGEGLVQVEVAHVGADVAGAREAHLCVHVGAVHVHLAAVGVDRAQMSLMDLLKHAVRGRVGDHEAAQRLSLVLLGLGAEVGHIDVARSSHLTTTTSMPGHHRAGGIGAVGRGGDQRRCCGDRFALRLRWYWSDDQQSGVFALRARVGLERDGIEAGDLAQRIFSVALKTSDSLWSDRAARTDGCWRTRARLIGVQLAGGVQLHGAGARGYHAECISERSLFSNRLM